MASSAADGGDSPPPPPPDAWLSTHVRLQRKIGQGSFGSVYLVRSRRDNRQYALKKLVGLIEPRNVLNELTIMCDYGGGHENVMGLIASNRVGGDVYLLMKYVSHDRFKDIVDRLTGSEIMGYMRQLFAALGYLHAKCIAHRDVKPSNILYSYKRRRLMLTDFGLSEVYDCAERAAALIAVGRKRRLAHSPTRANGKRMRLSPSAERGCAADVHQRSPARPGAVKRLFSPQQSNEPRGAVASKAAPRHGGRRQRQHAGAQCRCHESADGAPLRCAACDGRPVQKWNKSGTPGFRAPEAILRSAAQGTKVDVWAAGVILLSLLCGRYPLMRPDDDAAALLQLCLLCGMGDMKRLAQDMGKRLRVRPSPPEHGLDLVKLHAACRLSDWRAAAADYCRHCSPFVAHCGGGAAHTVCFCGDTLSRQRTVDAWCRRAHCDSADRLSDLAGAERRLLTEVLYAALTAHPDERVDAAVAEVTLPQC